MNTVPTPGPAKRPTPPNAGPQLFGKPFGGPAVVLLVLLGIAFVTVFFRGQTSVPLTISYDQFIREVEADNVGSVEIVGDTIRGSFKKPPAAERIPGGEQSSVFAVEVSRYLVGDGLDTLLLAHNVRTTVRQPTDGTGVLLGIYLLVPLLLMAAFWVSLRRARDPMGGSGIAYWPRIASKYGLKLEIVNDTIDPRFSFMTLDRDGKIRMDCSSPYAMARLVDLRNHYDIAFGNDTDFDRHGIVTPSWGLLNPNHYLSVAISYLFTERDWDANAAVGKTLVSSAMIDRIAKDVGHRLAEVPVGFKWFVNGLVDGSYGFGGEESAGASFLRKNGRVWTTDKDGIVMNLLAAEITAVTGKDPGECYQMLTQQFGAPVYERIDAPATPAQKAALKNMSESDLDASDLAGEPIEQVLTRAPENDAPIGGLKVTTKNGWFAARPSGTEDVYKIYAESFSGREHLATIQREAKELIGRVFEKEA